MTKNRPSAIKNRLGTLVKKKRLRSFFTQKKVQIEFEAEKGEWHSGEHLTMMMIIILMCVATSQVSSQVKKRTVDKNRNGI